MNLKALSRRALWKYWYPYLTRLTRDSAVIFLNYGYVDLNPQARPIILSTEDESNRLYIQLYHHVAGVVDLTDLEVMEVSCGHGGGALYIKHYLHPESYLGVDRNPKAIEFCRRHYAIDGLSFSQGDAEALLIDNASFDAIINVEASHCYGHMELFLKEVSRLLRPGGYFLFADFRPTPAAEILHNQLMQSGLELVKEENITLNVVKAMEMDSEERLELIRKLVPKIFQNFFRQFAGVKGSRMFESFKSGDKVYVCYALRKPSA